MKDKNVLTLKKDFFLNKNIQITLFLMPLRCKCQINTIFKNVLYAMSRDIKLEFRILLYVYFYFYLKVKFILL